MKTEQEITTRTQQIFKSRLGLYFAEEKLRKDYLNYEENHFDKSIIKNVCFSVLLFIYAILNIGFYKNYNEPDKVVIIFSVCLAVNCFSIFVIILIKYKKYFSENNFRITKVLLGINYFILEINFFLSIWFIKLEAKNYEFLIFLSSISTTLKIIYIFISQANYKIILLATIISIFFEVIIVTNYPLWLTDYPIFTNYLILITCLVLSYYEYFRNKINFLVLDKIKSSKENNKFYEEFCEKQKNSMISINRLKCDIC